MIRISTISSSLSGWIVIGVCFAIFLPSAAHAACSQWDISGEWVAVQSNDTKPIFTLQQTGTEIQGSGHWGNFITYNTFPARGDDYVEADGSVDGTINGDTVEFTAYWSDNTIGVYSGKIGPQGRIQGTTYDKQHPQSMASWYSDRTFKCEDATSAENSSPSSTTAGADGLAPKALGRAHSSTPAPPLARIGNEPMICAQARSARARNSPVASELEAKCQEAGGSFTDRVVTQAPANIRERNALAVSRVGIPAPPADVPPADAPRMPDDRGMPGENFAPPLFDDGAQVWACANAAQGSKKAGACDGMKAGKAFCKMRGHSGALQQHRDGSPALTPAPARTGIPVRAANGDVCAADNCAVIGELDCAP